MDHNEEKEPATDTTVETHRQDAETPADAVEPSAGEIVPALAEAPAETPAEPPAEAEPEPPKPEPKYADDYVEEAYECFLAHAPEDSESTNPVKAIEEYFQKNASDDLKARVRAEGKTAEGAWKFAWAVGERMPSSARQGGGFHVEPRILYAIIMHYFEDVPALSRFEASVSKKAAEAKPEPHKKKSAKAKAAKPKAKKQEKVAKVKPETAKPKAPPAPAPARPQISAAEQRERDSGQSFLF